MMDDSSDDERESLAGERSHDPSTVFATLIKFDFNYITKTWIGRVKLAQLICCILAGCILPTTIAFYFTRFSFYTFVIWTCFMYIFIDILIHVTSIAKLAPDFCRTTDIMMYPLFIGALTLLLSASLVASVTDIHHGSRATRIGFSAFFGLILMALFLFEAFLQYRRARNNGVEPPLFSFTLPRRRAPTTDIDAENGNIPAGRNIVISRPTSLRAVEEQPPPYSKGMEGADKGGVAMPLGSYGGQ